MPDFALDANCLVAAVSRRHYAKVPVQREVDRRLAASEKMVLPAHALAEAFSVLTRRPAPERMTPSEAHTALDISFIREARVAALDADAYLSLLARLATLGVGGGRVYDEAIAETASRAGAAVLLTLNPKHFPSPPAGLTIVDPTAGFAAPADDHS